MIAKDQQRVVGENSIYFEIGRRPPNAYSAPSRRLIEKPTARSKTEATSRLLCSRGFHLDLELDPVDQRTAPSTSSFISVDASSPENTRNAASPLPPLKAAKRQLSDGRPKNRGGCQVADIIIDELRAPLFARQIANYQTLAFAKLEAKDQND